MSDEKVQKEKESKSDGKLEKQVANIAFTVRKMKDWMEEKLGADLDGDGRIGGGPYKKVLVFLLIAGMAAFCLAEDRTAIAYWSDNAKVTSDGFVGDMAIEDGTISGTLGVTGVATFSSNVNIGVNAAVGGVLVVTGNITNSALTASKPVFTDANKKLVSTGTLAVDQGGSGATTFTDHGILLGSAATAFSVTAVGTDGQVLLGATGADPTWGTMSGNAAISAAGAVTIQPGVIVTAMLATAEAASLGLADTAIQPDEVYGVVSITGDAGVAGQLLLTNVVQTLAIDGTTPLTDYAVVHVWVSETDMGVASTNNIEALTLSGGTAVATVTADADYWYVTDSAGALTVVVEASAQDTTNYVMVAVGPQIESKALVFPAP